MKSIQEVYDEACEYLCSMKEPSIGSPNPFDEDLSEDNKFYSGCKYRGPGGARCVVGYFIPDEKYQVSMEGNGVGSLPILEALGELSEYRLLFSKLQEVHDTRANWNESGFVGCTELDSIADDFDLVRRSERR